MRAIWFCYVMVLVSLGTGVLNNFNDLHVRDKGYPLLPVIVSGTVYTTLDESTYNSTVSQYGFDRVPAQAGDSSYLGTGGTLLGTYNAFEGVFMVGTLGLNKFIQNVAPDTPPAWLILISAIVTLNNIYASISFIRGVSARWL